jgi:hypothetical protein
MDHYRHYIFNLAGIGRSSFGAGSSDGPFIMGIRHRSRNGLHITGSRRSRRESMVSSADWNWHFTVWAASMAALFAVLLALCFMRESPSDVGILPYGQNEPSEIGKAEPASALRSVFHGLQTGIRSKPFWLLSGSFFICGLSTNGLIGTHLIPACMEHGIPEITAAD